MTAGKERDIRDKINESFEPMFTSHARDLFVYGSAAAGKSYSVAQKAILKCLKYPKRKFVIIRRFTPSLRLTCFAIVKKLIDEWGIPCNINNT